MKKLLVIAIAVLTTASVFAQKQNAGDKNVELNFAPLGGSPLSINGLKFRMFNDEKTALRGTVFIGYSSNRTVDEQEGTIRDTTMNRNFITPELSTFDRMLNVTLRPGIEKHFDGTDRLSPYIGGELILGFGRETQKVEKFSLSQLDDASTTSDEVEYEEWEIKTTDGSFTYGLGAFTGFDFYLAEGFYMGAEVGFGLSVTNQGDTKTEISNAPAWSFEEFFFIPDNEGDINLPDDQSNGGMSQIGPTVNAQIRVGYILR